MNKGVEFTETQVKKYMNLGFQFGGRLNPDNSFSYFNQAGYWWGQDDAGEDNPTQASNMKISTPPIDRWAVNVKHYTYPVTSQGRAHGEPVRCVRDKKN